MVYHPILALTFVFICFSFLRLSAKNMLTSKTGVWHGYFRRFSSKRTSIDSYLFGNQIMNIENGHQQAKWSAEFCSCGDDCVTCIITCCLPCITFGQIAEIVDEQNNSCIVLSCIYGLLWSIQCHWIYSCMYRERLRSKFGLPADPCCDCCVHFCCEPCALCQEHAELKKRGFDPSIGWIGSPSIALIPMPPTMER